MQQSTFHIALFRREPDTLRPVFDCGSLFRLESLKVWHIDKILEWSVVPKSLVTIDTHEEVRVWDLLLWEAMSAGIKTPKCPDCWASRFKLRLLCHFLEDRKKNPFVDNLAPKRFYCDERKPLSTAKHPFHTKANGCGWWGEVGQNTRTALSVQPKYFVLRDKTIHCSSWLATRSEIEDRSLRNWVKYLCQCEQ